MYRLTIYPAFNVDTEAKITSEQKTLGELHTAIDVASGLLLFIQDEMNVMADHTNVFICEQYTNGEWKEIGDK